MKRENMMRQMELQKKILETKSYESGVTSIRTLSLQNESQFLDKWVEETKKYVGMASSEYEQSNSNRVIPMELKGGRTASTSFLTKCGYNHSSAFPEVGERRGDLLKFSRQCLENTANTNKLLLRQRLRDLCHFSGELTEWTIFISEFNRTTEMYGLTDEENLIRLDRSLRGKARETVRALLTSSSNVPRIIKMLEMNFGRAEWIIMSLIQKVKKLCYIKDDKLDSYITFSNAVSNMVTAMKNINSDLYLHNPDLLSNLVEKLTPILKHSWGKYKLQLERQYHPITLETFAEWFEEETNLVAGISNPFNQRYATKNSSKKENVMISKQKIKEKHSKMATGCVVCGDTNHIIQECGEFLEKTIPARRETAANLKLCFSCLSKGHISIRCHSKNKCGKDNCRGRHNALLHLERENAVPESNQNDFCGTSVALAENTVLLRIAPVKIRGPAGELLTYALFDEGSTCSMMDKDLADKLKLVGPTVPLCYQWTNGITHFEDDSQVISVDISASTSSEFYIMNQVRTVRNICLPRQDINVDVIVRKYPYLDREILESVKSATPQILIGQDNCGLIVPRQIIQPKLDKPILSRSRLGWTINGAINFSECSNETSHVSLCCRQIHDEDLHFLIKDSFKLETFGIDTKDTLVKSAEDKKALQIMENTLKKVENHFEIGHLWRNENQTLPDSQRNAMRRLLCMERKMDKDEKFADMYCQKIHEYQTKNYARLLESSEVLCEKSKTWYLPHFAVYNINKPGKLRLVFDAAAKSHGYSLNDFLLQGPDYVPSLVAVLWRFRQGKFAFNGDIRDMFHQVLIRKQDRCAQRFLWRGKDRNREPDVYEMNVMIFGAVSSPSVAQFVKNKNAMDFEQQFPGITRAIQRQHYVDDYLDSCNTEEEATKRVAEVIHVHAQGGFEMTKWISNSKKVIQSVPEILRSDSQNQLTIDSEKVERVLGLSWKPETDDFIFTLNLKKIPQEIVKGAKVPTKREVLRLVMSIFDPLGFLAPSLLKGKLLMQEIWKTSIDWDSEIPQDLFEIWRRWLTELQCIAPISIPRYYFPEIALVQKVQLHVVCDASDKVYAAVAYFRVQVGEKVSTAFVTSKYKVAPLRQQTIPKLELQAAVLACRVAKSVMRETEYEIEEVFYWTDSMVVLHQIRSHSKRFPMFVACRIGEIQEETAPSQWRWIPSEINVADQATKIMKFIDFGPESSWLNGPSFLKHTDVFWPEEPIPDVDKDVQHVLVVTKIQDADILPDIERFSQWKRLIRSSAWVLFAKKMFLTPKVDRPRRAYLGVNILGEAKKRWILKSQKESFEEIETLKKGHHLEKNSRLYKLSVFVDEEGIIRLYGRFPDSDRLNFDYDSQHPIVLDPNHRYTLLLVDHYHREAGHIGIETVINNLRSRFWILHVRVAVKRCFNSCLQCRKRKCNPAIPKMGLMPPSRLEAHVFPFTYVGIDFFGPISVAVGRRNEKRYGVLFTCFSIRAVHIELASSLDTSSAVMAIRRFMSRRGQPKEFWTDCGTNFVGAERELREWITDLNHDEISNKLALNGTIWKFNCPGAPHMAGVWERMVKAIKTALRITLKTVKPREEVLITLLCEAEYMVNSRPLTHISVDPDDPVAITPNHFLLLRQGGVSSRAENSISTRKQWKFAQALADMYWKRWIVEYRPTLINRQKWHDQMTPVQIGDVVVIVDEKAPRTEWLMGRIEETFPGKDGVIRVAKVFTKKGSYTRPVSKLCILPTSTEDR